MLPAETISLGRAYNLCIALRHSDEFGLVEELVLRCLLLLFVVLYAFFGMAGSTGFIEDREKYPRARDARLNTAATIDSLERIAGVEADSLRLFIRVLKRECIVEVWAGNVDNPMKLLTSYEFTAYSGKLGPKRAEGDRQIPEGCYFIDRFNPSSAYHLSLGLNYPNKSDRIRASSSDPGCDIFIHGDDVTIGCIPVGDSAIEELYTLCVDARDSGQERIPVHVFPCRMSSAKRMRMLGRISKDDQSLGDFWAELKPIYDSFQKHKRVPKLLIDKEGAYILSP